MAIASLIFGILSIIVAVIGLFSYSAVAAIGMTVGVLSIILSVVSRKYPKESEKLSQAGLVCSIVAISISVLALVFSIIHMSNVASGIADTFLTKFMSYWQ